MTVEEVPTVVERIPRALEVARLARMPDDEPADESHGAERVSLRAEFTVPIQPTEQVTIERESLRDNRIVFWDDMTTASSAYRMLRAQVLQRVRAHSMTTIGVVSAVNGEGKTLTAVNLALSLAAEPNQSVALIDLDLRRPAVARTLGLNVPRGLCSYFPDGAPLDRFCYGVSGAERLLLLPTLAPISASSETLAGNSARKLFAELKAREPGRLLIVDLPPVLLSDDVLTAAPMLDGLVLVASEARTRREDVARVLELLSSVRIIGTVLNRASESEKRAY